MDETEKKVITAYVVFYGDIFAIFNNKQRAEEFVKKLYDKFGIEYTVKEVKIEVPNQ